MLRQVVLDHPEWLGDRTAPQTFPSVNVNLETQYIDISMYGNPSAASPGPTVRQCGGTDSSLCSEVVEINHCEPKDRGNPRRAQSAADPHP